MTSFHLRSMMVESQIRARGVADARVLAAMDKVPRERFVPLDVQSRAYDDSPLPIGYGQTISQPYVVAFMTEILAIEPTDRVLEIGTGCGYQAAILAELAAEVYTVEIIEDLAMQAAATLEALGYRNVFSRHGNGYEGWPDAAPFSKILVAAAPERVPHKLIDQLAEGGSMIVPVGPCSAAQELTLIQKTVSGPISRDVMSVSFVPMVDPAKPRA
jgi:protein-L-isoaspartate(D-aspartate) O-methyltransferase